MVDDGVGEDFDDDDGVELDAEENTVEVGCCFEGEEEEVLLENVVDDNFNSARLRLTPCSTGSNSSERFSDATANILTNLKNKNIKRIG